MGKKLKKNSRQAWKKSEVAKEYEDKMKVIREEERMQNTADSALFFEDKTGSKRLRKVVFEEDIERESPKNEKRMIKMLKKQLAAKPAVEKKRSTSKNVYDLWETPEQKKFDSNGFLKEEDFEISIKKRKTPRSIVTPNNFPAVDIPKGGASYNPDEEQHQDLLGEQLAMELSYEEELERRKQLPGGLTLKDLHSQRIQGDVLASSLLFDEEDEKEDEALLNDEESIHVGPVQVKRIPDSKRRRMQEMKAMKREALERKKERQRMNDFDQTKRIIKELDEEEKNKQISRDQENELNSLLKEQEKPAILRGGKKQYPLDEIPKVDVLLSDEITKDLRTMKNVVSAVKDRFESIDRRQLVQMGGEKPKEKYARLRAKKGITRRRF